MLTLLGAYPSELCTKRKRTLSTVTVPCAVFFDVFLTRVHIELLIPRTAFSAAPGAESLKYPTPYVSSRGGNSPAHPTSLFSPQSARGEPRHVGCSALSTTSARSRALCCGFSYKNFAGTGPIAHLRGVWLQNPCGGTRCAGFGECARVFRGGSPGSRRR